MNNTLFSTDFKFPKQVKKYAGKVRDVYYLEDDRLVVVASDRISAFDTIMPKGIPYKGQVLNQIAAKMMESVSDIVPTWIEATPDPNVSIGQYCTPFKIEMVIRGYLSGHAAREYKVGKRILCGEKMPEGMRENDAFPSPIITPATKAEEGHDEDISKEDIIANNIVSKEDFEQLENYTYALFERGTALAKEKGLILVDTKYEFGKTKEGTIVLIDEIHTPDSSRYFYQNTYEELQKKQLPQKQLSKEFARQWLISNGFQGLEGQKLPVLENDFIQSVSDRYIELYEKIIGEPFEKNNISNVETRIFGNVEKYILK